MSILKKLKQPRNQINFVILMKLCVCFL